MRVRQAALVLAATLLSAADAVPPARVTPAASADAVTFNNQIADAEHLGWRPR